ncbi:hypothetical protein HMPREF1392_00126 [Helicobacter pylori GAM101Biv]|nr:hypothetical protein HMPREF1392_00126 [Helicobacter pylori GAM101Biv]
MKALKTFLKKSLILLLVIALNHLNAVAMIVDNPTQNIWQQAKDAMTSLALFNRSITGLTKSKDTKR